ncbi:MAG: helix-turn-helix transcriptional regulator [Lachnospiraceae bacterium]|nr:helix-turn-helix transcriptional regulator [Lachnospiraceae bacterium]
MILADKIINERKKNGWSQEELADMLNVSRQSVSKWEGAQSVPDLQKILKMAEIFGVSTDYLLKDEMEPEGSTELKYVDDDSDTPLRKVTLEEASEFISLRKKVLPKIGIGVFLMITCPVILVLLAGISSSYPDILTEKAATVIGLLFMFIQIGVAIYTFVINSEKLMKYKFLEEEAFETAYGVDGMAKDRLAEYEASNTKALTLGVLLCVLCAVPLVITAVMEAPNIVIICMVCLTLILVGIAVYLFISVCAVYSSYKILLQTDDYTPRKKRKNKKLDTLTSSYWILIVIIYLVTSFMTNGWHFTWVIWAVAGLLFALVRNIAEAMIKD